MNRIGHLGERLAERDVERCVVRRISTQNHQSIDVAVSRLVGKLCDRLAVRRSLGGRLLAEDDCAADVAEFAVQPMNPGMHCRGLPRSDKDQAFLFRSRQV